VDRDERDRVVKVLQLADPEVHGRRQRPPEKLALGAFNPVLTAAAAGHFRCLPTGIPICALRLIELFKFHLKI
jgi:hypothetical protein